MPKTAKNYMMFTSNMKPIKNRLCLLILILSCTLSGVSAQITSFSGNSLDNALAAKFPRYNIKFRKYGPYIGVQRGAYTIGECGVEKQFKRVKLVHPVTHAFHTGFNYNFKYNVLGYDFGYWFQVGRLDLTYGANAYMRTDFNETRIGLGPVVGFKLFQFHLQTGYHFLTPATHFEETNTFFITLRLVLINSRKIDIERIDKPKKDKEKDKEKKGLFRK